MHVTNKFWHHFRRFFQILNNIHKFKCIKNVVRDCKKIISDSVFSHVDTDFVIERKSDSSNMCQERPASTDNTLLYSCSLPTSLTLVFYHLKLTENREREEKACLTVDKPQRLLLNTVWQTRTN